MTHFSFVGELDPVKIWEGVSARVVSGEQAALTVVELEPNAHVREHHHPNEQTGILLRGAVRFRIDDEEKELRPGDMWVVPADAPHEVHAGVDGAFIVELFAPPRADWDGFERLPPSTPAGF
ncbi:MAG TPA: cupin domain-containing protein [Gaiellaceae bacterium]|nr:cupin domain-containing protein [Gaiellaceae bacterium]